MSDLGDTLSFRSDVYDKPVEQGGVLVNATTVALTITLPDGTTAPAITVSNPPATTGKYAYDYVTSSVGPPGRYVGQWLFTMSTGKTTSYVETFDVGASLITVDEAQAHLRSVGVITTATDLDQLQWLCFVASDAVERDLGRVFARRTITETYDGARGSIILRSTPVISITTVTESGTGLVSTDWLLDSSNGILHRGSTSSILSWGWGRQNIVVTYVAGYLDPPRAVRAVALALVQALWQQSQQAAHPILDESGFEIPIVSAVSGLPAPLRQAYESLRAAGIA